MIVAGLTGGIATGKSTVAAFFRDAGAIVIDADAIAHAVVRKGRPAWQAIADHFGRPALLPDGEINRKYIGAVIFNDSSQKRILNDIVHPYVFQEIKARQEEIARLTPNAVVIPDIPLLIETGLEREMAEVIVVYVPEQLQIQRLIARDNLSEAEAIIRIRAQMPIEEKKRRVRLVIDNSKSLAHTKDQAMAIYQELNARQRKKKVRCCT